jgi:hypothetical protein
VEVEARPTHDPPGGDSGATARAGDHRPRDGQGLVKNPMRSAIDGPSSLQMSASLGPMTMALASSTNSKLGSLQ